MNQIIQRKGFEVRSYKIDSDSEFIEVFYKSIKDKVKYRIQLVEVGNEIQYEAENTITNPHRIFSIFFGTSAIISIFCYFLVPRSNPVIFIFLAILMSILCFISLIQPVKDDIVIVNGVKPIRLFRSKPNEKKVIEFANKLIKIANQKKKELAIDFDLNEEQFLGNIQWLLSMKLIDRKELEKLKSEYKLKRLI